MGAEDTQQRPEGLNHAVADGLVTSNPAAFVQSLPLGHIERDYLRLHEIGRYLDGCSETYRTLAEMLIGTLPHRTLPGRL